jgi:phosphate-selective porin OprO/OprP
MLFLFALAVPRLAMGQAEESEMAPVRGDYTPAAYPEPDQPFAIPDVSEKTVEETQVRDRWFTMKLGLVMLVDYTAFDQDTDSLNQVGEQEDEFEVRSARVILRGKVGDDHAIGYKVSAEYKGFDTEPGDEWSLTDLSLSFKPWGPATEVLIGKTKETFGYELVGDAANLPQQERVLNPFYVSRSTGVKITSVLGEKQHMTVSAGVFNADWLNRGSTSERGTDFSARVTGLLWDDVPANRFLHLGLTIRRRGADDDMLRYSGRPASNVSDNYVDTGEFAADHAWHLGFEALWNRGPYSLLVEHNQAWTDAPESGDPHFTGYYLTASWVVTGETRMYDRTVGYARRVMPTGRWGAPEIVARYSNVDLDDDAIHGGKFDQVYLGVNWWATRRWKVGAGWGRTWLDRFNTTGVTDSFLTRIQWVF